MEFLQLEEEHIEEKRPLHLIYFYRIFTVFLHYFYIMIIILIVNRIYKRKGFLSLFLHFYSFTRLVDFKF